VKLIDVSVPIRDGMFAYRGNPGVRLTLEQALARGDGANISRLDFGVHSGTHIDAPRHFFDDGAGAESIDPALLIGSAHVVDATAVAGALDAAALESLALPERETRRLLFKTTNSELWARDEFTPDFVRFDESGARVLVERGVRVVGIDYLSIGDGPAHRLLLSAGVVPLEGLDLRHVAPGPYRLHCCAIAIAGSDGAPARALLEPL
jgi:arylformamidase